MNNGPKTALITGASSGIGAAFARQLASQGYNLVLVARRHERLATLATDLQQQTSCEILAADLSNPIDISRVEERIATLETLDMLINNAGFITGGRFARKEIARQIDMIQVHVMASKRLSRAALPGMIDRGQGAIINVSSISAFNPVAGNETYGATKAYLNFFSKCLQAELRGTGIRVQALCPGYTYTEMTESLDRSQIPKMVPWMSAEEVVEKSLHALKRNQVVYIPGFKNRLIVALYLARSHSNLLRNYKFRKILTFISLKKFVVFEIWTLLYAVFNLDAYWI
jgi:short-subunit dehydrogenase